MNDLDILRQQSQDDEPLTLREAQANQHIEGIKLVIEHRRCGNCGAEHTVPNPKLLAVVSKPGTTRSSEWIAFSKVPSNIRARMRPDVPCERMNIFTSSEACHLCFDSYRPQCQGEMFIEREAAPAPRQRRGPRDTPTKTEAAPKPALVRTLADY